MKVYFMLVFFYFFYKSIYGINLHHCDLQIFELNTTVEEVVEGEATLTYNIKILNIPCIVHTAKLFNPHKIYEQQTTTEVTTTSELPTTTIKPSTTTTTRPITMEQSKHLYFKMRYLNFNEYITKNKSHDIDFVYILGQYLSHWDFIECQYLNFNLNYQHLNAIFYRNYFDISVSYINNQFRLTLLPTFISEEENHIFKTSLIQPCHAESVYIYNFPCYTKEPHLMQYISNLTQVTVIYNVPINMSVYGPLYGVKNYIERKKIDITTKYPVAFLETDAISIYIFQKDENGINKISVVGYNTWYFNIETFYFKFYTRMVQGLLKMDRICSQTID